MKVQTTGAALAIAAMLAGCATPYSEAPLATNFPTTKQEKVQAAAHWNVIAKDVAKQISSRLAGRPLHVVPSTGKSAFERAFSNQLVSSLVANGHAVMKQPAGALSVEVDTQVVGFSPNRPQYPHAGTATALATGIWALHDVGKATAGAALYATVAAADAYGWFRSEFATGETPRTEIVVTTSVSDGNQFLSRATSVYYVADSDKALYESAATGVSGHNIKMKGGE